MTSLIRFHYRPLAEFGRLRLFDDAFHARVFLYPSQYTSTCPRMDLKGSENDSTVTATFELPGLKREDITLDLEQNRLTVSSGTAATHSVEQEGNAIRERRRSRFSRTLQLPFGTKPEDVKAKLEDGLLTVTFPREAAEKQAQRIAIQ